MGLKSLVDIGFGGKLVIVVVLVIVTGMGYQKLVHRLLALY